MEAAGLLRTEVRYLSADGDGVVTSLAQLDGDRAVRGRPVRKISSHRGQRHYPGLFWSATTGGHVPYESRLELERLWLADFDRQVDWMASQPLWLLGTDGSVVRRHVPDLLLRERDGDFALVDVKPATLVDSSEVAAVFAWTGRLCASKGWRYEVWSGASAVLLANVRWLGSSRRLQLMDPGSVEAVAGTGRSGMTVDEIARAAAARVGVATARQAVLALLWSGQWMTNLLQPLSGDSIVRWSSGTS